MAALRPSPRTPGSLSSFAIARCGRRSPALPNGKMLAGDRQDHRLRSLRRPTASCRTSCRIARRRSKTCCWPSSLGLGAAGWACIRRARQHPRLLKIPEHVIPGGNCHRLAGRAPKPRTRYRDSARASRDVVAPRPGGPPARPLAKAAPRRAGSLAPPSRDPERAARSGACGVAWRNPEIKPFAPWRHSR